MQNTNIVLWGIGAMGSGIFRSLCNREGVSIIGAIGRNPQKIGKDLGEVFGQQSNDVIITKDADKVLKQSNPDLVIHSTGSFFKDINEELQKCVKAGCNVITIAEEMAEPWVADKILANNLDREAKQNGVSILGTGINPGFVLDLLIIALTGVCTDIKSIEAERVNDLSPFGQTVMKTQGVGTTPEEFARGVVTGDIVGHIGFPQSVGLISKALGWQLDYISEKKDPIITKVKRKTMYVSLEPGMVAGCNHHAYGYKNGELVVTLKHPQQVCPEEEGTKTGDFIKIVGNPQLNLSIHPEIPGGTGTIAMAINMIPGVMKSTPGLKTLLDFNVPACWSKLELLTKIK